MAAHGRDDEGVPAALPNLVAHGAQNGRNVGEAAAAGRNADAHTGRNPAVQRSELAGDRRITPFQATLLQAQLERLEDQAQRRADNGSYLNDLLDDLEGIGVRRIDDFATRPAHHVYVFRYLPEAFKGLSRERFVEAMNAEGIPVSKGYRQPLHRTALFADVDGALARAWPRGDGTPDIDYAEVSCPHAERLCADETLFLAQSVLLDDEAGMVQIADAIEKVREHAEALLAADGGATPRSDRPSA